MVLKIETESFNYAFSRIFFGSWGTFVIPLNGPSIHHGRGRSHSIGAQGSDSGDIHSKEEREKEQVQAALLFPQGHSLGSQS